MIWVTDGNSAAAFGSATRRWLCMERNRLLAGHTDSEHKAEQMGQILAVTDQLLLEHEEA